MYSPRDFPVTPRTADVIIIRRVHTVADESIADDRRYEHNVYYYIVTILKQQQQYNDNDNTPSSPPRTRLIAATVIFFGGLRFLYKYIYTFILTQ